MVRVKAIIRTAWNRDGINLWFFRDDGQRLYVAKPFEIAFEEKPRDNAWELPEPTVFIRSNEFKELRESLVEELASAGVIDRTAAETARELKATKYHLEDMRTLTLRGAP